MTKKIIQLANLIIKMAAEKGDLITNLKLQKLLYYEQGYHLACFGKPLFNEEVLAWQYGPVVREVYDAFSKCGGRALMPQGGVYSFRNKEEEALFEEVFDAYNKYSASYLVEMTHNEAPWKSVQANTDSVISKESMKAFFEKKVV